MEFSFRERLANIELNEGPLLRGFLGEFWITRRAPNLSGLKKKKRN